MTTPKMNMSLSEIFDVELTQTDKSLETLKIEAKSESIDSLESQRDYVKKNIVALIEKGNTALDNLTIIANSTESYKDFAVVSDMIKTLVDTNITLLDCEVAHKKPAVDNNKPVGDTVHNNTVAFVGSTSELSKYIKSLSLNNNDIIDIGDKTNNH